MKELKDKGFELIYYKLSYRRRYIRTLWTIPWGLLAVLLMFLAGWPLYVIIPVTILIIVSTYIQGRHNYKKWKEEDK